jgi:hypothetical protein
LAQIGPGITPTGGKGTHTHTRQAVTPQLGGRPKPAANPASHLTGMSHTSVDPHGYAPLGVDCTHAACCSAKGGWEGAELGAMVVLANAERDEAKLRRGTKGACRLHPVDPLPETRIHEGREPPHSSRPPHGYVTACGIPANMRNDSSVSIGPNRPWHYADGGKGNAHTHTTSGDSSAGWPA